ncbi:MAG: DUF4249 domain-containing protein [Spirosomataceae bacterium]
MKNLSLILFVILSMTSCVEVVQLDLRSVEPQIVIDGKITDSAIGNEVKITLTQDFQQKNEFPPITTAEVTVTDVTTGQSETLTQTYSGVYSIQTLKGIPGHHYKMAVNYNGNVYEATSTMPAKVPFDELKYQEVTRFQTNIRMVAVYNDPKDQTNYYRWATIGNDGIRSRAYFVRSDAFNNGNRIEQVIDSGIDIHSGDKITIEMQCIDKATYEYFLTLGKQQGQGPNSGSSGVNPPATISGGALGYFGAYTVEYKTAEIK